MRQNLQSSKRGFTIIELLVVLTSLSLVSVSTMIVIPTQLARARDARKKWELEQFRIAMEDYRSDTNCYPDPSQLLTCGDDQLSPYLRKYFCEEGTRPYTYVRSENCRCYAVYTTLELSSKDVEKVGCESGCGPDRFFNYGVSNRSLY